MRAAVVILSTLALAACHVESHAEGEEARQTGGTATNRTFEVGAFDAVTLAGSHNIVVRVGPAASVRAEGAAADLDRLDIRTDDGTLRIGTRKEWAKNHRFGPVTVHVTTPSLAAASLAGSGDMKIDRVEGKHFSASVAGSGDIEVGQMKVGEAKINIAGSGGAKAAGSASSIRISIAGSGGVDMGGVESRTASVSIAGSGDVTARATETADISLMGSGNALISGTAKCKVSSMGSGKARCGA